MAGRKALQILDAAAAAENSQVGRQQQEPLGVADTAKLAALQQAMKKTDHSA